MNVTNRKLFIVALIFALIATLMLYFYLTKLEEDSKRKEPTTEVIVAKMTIPVRTLITKDMLQIKLYRTDSMPATVFKSMNEVVGKIAKDTIYIGEPIIHEQIADKVYQKLHLAYTIPKGYRAITVQYNPVMGVGGFIQPGDYVDIIGTFTSNENSLNQDVSKLLLQKVLVLAVGEKTDVELTNEKKDIGTITLAVQPKEAEKITFTSEKGSIRLLLRPIHEDKSYTTTGASKDNILTP